MKLLYAHAKGLDRADLERRRARLLRHLAAKGATDVEVVTGLEDWHRSKPIHRGDWRAWARGWAGVGLDGKPRYDGILVDRDFGRGVGGGLLIALRLGRPVILWRPKQGTFVRVLEVVPSDDPTTWGVRVDEGE